MVNISSIPSLARPGLKPKYPMTGRKEEDQNLMDKTKKRSDKLLNTPSPKLPGMTPNTKKIKMPTSTSY